MPFREPLTPWITHVADPRDLPVRQPGESGPSRVLKARVESSEPGSLRLRAQTACGDHLFVGIEAAADGVVRVRLAPSDTARTRSASVTRMVTPRGCSDTATTTGEDGAIRLNAGDLVAEVTLDPWGLRFLDRSGRLLVEENNQESDISGRLRILPFGRSLDVAGQPLAYHETFTARPDEHFYGLGEKFTEFDKRGQYVVSWNYDAFSSESERSYKNVPFYLSSRGYGILVDSGSGVRFDLCHSTHSCAQVIAPDDLLDYYVIHGPDPRRIIDRYHGLTGRPVVPPKWALGTWFSTGYFRENDQKRTLDIARRLRERAIPCDVLHLDAYWQRRGLWSHMLWDEERYPDPENMLAQLRELGFRVCLWINPYISVDAPLFEEGAALGHFMTHADGSAYVADSWHGAHPPCGIVDFTSAAATAWFQNLLRPLLRSGVSVFKTDFGEGIPVDAVTASGLDGEAVHNVYSLLFNDAVADVTQEVHGHRVVWARSSFTGGQRHCGQWAGDNNTTYTAMASTLRGGLSYALSGVPFWSHDAGGFTGTPTPDLFVRSSQFAALSPLTRFHGTSSRFPWDFEPSVEEAIREALRLRYQLMPYLYSAAVEAGRSGLPVMRPLLLDTPGDPGAWSADLEYLLGSDLLVAPMISPEGERHLYLPSGQWIDFWTGEVHDGGRHLLVRTPLERVPLFVRMDSLIVMAPELTALPDGPFTDLTVTCWGGGAARTVVHDEAGRTTVSLARAGHRAALTSEGPLRIARVSFRHGSTGEPPREVLVNGVPAEQATEDGLWTVADTAAPPTPRTDRETSHAPSQ